jgi:septum formation protein
VEAPPSAADFLLASRSPRRIDYLHEAGYRFAIWPADVAEVPAPGESPADYALRVAVDKARAALALHPGRIALGADTDVVLRGRILGKPADAAEATAMLSALAGRTHEVISAVAVTDGQQCVTAITVTEIDFTPLSAALIAQYVASGECMGKAGAYGIQGGAARFVRAVRGSYTGVVGLPMAETCECLARFGIVPGGPPQ